MDPAPPPGQPSPASARWPRIAAAAVSRLAGADVVTSVRTDRPLVALTVDDGPHPATTPALLDVLAGHGAGATFFTLGERALAHPGLPARIAAAGHELGNHLLRDEPSVLLAAPEFDRQLARTHEILQSVLAAHAATAAFGTVRWFRPGSGWFTPRMLRAGRRLGYRCALGSPGLAVADYPRPRALGERLAARCGAGDVVVLHEGTADRAAVADVAAALLDGLARRGLRAAALTALVDGDADGDDGDGAAPPGVARG